MTHFKRAASKRDSTVAPAALIGVRISGATAHKRVDRHTVLLFSVSRHTADRIVRTGHLGLEVFRPVHSCAICCVGLCLTILSYASEARNRSNLV